jgi:hypothetical protein
MKTCSLCKIEKDLDLFSFRRSHHLKKLRNVILRMVLKLATSQKIVMEKS